MYDLKISIKDLENIKLYKHQGLSFSQIFSAYYENKEVIVKAQKEGSLRKTDSNDDKFLQELKILTLGIPGLVNILGWGDDFNGERFIVLERLYKLPKKLNVQKACNTILLATRQLYLHGFHWAANIKHLMVDANSDIKLIDFNDLQHQRKSFFDDSPQHNVFEVLEDLCKKYKIKDCKAVKENSIRYMLEKEFQSLENVHDPIYFQKYANIPKRITEPGKDNGKIRPANRICFDRADFIQNALKNYWNKRLTCLDLGSNTGWFTFFMNDLGFKTTGIDYDKNHWGSDRPQGWPKHTGGKIEFSKLLAYMNNRPVYFEDVYVNIQYVSMMPQYDVILALSILHLYFKQHKVSRDYWIGLFKGLCEKTKKVFIFEVPEYILPNLGLQNLSQLLFFTKDIGEFSSVKVLGRTKDGKRPLIMGVK